jgi:hypothetical protein
MGLDTKTYWLTDRQSQCDFDFDFDFDLSSSVSKRMRRQVCSWQLDFEVWICEDVKKGILVCKIVSCVNV